MGEFAQRMQREVLDSYDEELELELEDRPFMTMARR